MTRDARRRSILLPAVFLLAMAIPLSGWSAETTPEEAAPRLSSEQQQAALGFVKEHHPQLNALIARLEQRDPAEYDKALRDVFRTYERLQRLQARDPQRHEVELKLWKVESRIRLLAARMAARQGPELEGQLRDLLHERTGLRLQQLTLERERVTGRLQRLDSQISQLSTGREVAVEKEIDRLRRSVRARSVRVSGKRAAGKERPQERPDRSADKRSEAPPADPPSRRPDKPAPPPT